MFYQWHRDTFDIPAGAVHLARNDAFAAQAFCYGGHAYGIEFHPEMTLEMIRRWTASRKGSRMLTLPGAQPRATQLEGYHRHISATDRWLGRFLDERLLPRRTALGCRATARLRRSSAADALETGSASRRLTAPAFAAAARRLRADEHDQGAPSARPP